VAVNNNLNFKEIDKRVIERIERETNTFVRFAAGILRFKEFSFILGTLYLRCSVGMNEENEIRMKQLSMLVEIVGLPFLFMGDFNMSTTTFWQTGWSQFLKATMVDCSNCLSTLRHTSDRLIDWVLISDKIRGILRTVELEPNFPSTPHYSFCIELHCSPRLVTEPMLVLPRPLPMEDFKAVWRKMKESEQSMLVNRGRQKAQSMLAQHRLKSGIAILGFPLKQVLDDPLIRQRETESIKNGESLALSCLTAELTILYGASIEAKQFHLYIGRGQYPRIVNKPIVCKNNHSRYVSEDLNIWG
jgi:hypothetical protein